MIKFLKFVLIVLILALIVIVGTAYPTIKEYVDKTLYPIEYEEIVEEMAEKYELDEYLIYAIIRTESSFKEDAVSSADAMGLMQLTEQTYYWIMDIQGEERELEDIFDPEVNIEYGCVLLRRLINYFGDTDVALAAYNAGIGNVESWLDNSEYSSDGETLQEIPFEETRNYIVKVNDAVEKYKEIYQEN